MALKKDYILPTGTDLSFAYPNFQLCISSNEYTLTSAYIKIDKLEGDKNSINLSVGIYNEKDSIMVINKKYEFIPDVTDSAENFIKQGYEYLKTLDEYADALDC